MKPAYITLMIFLTISLGITLVNAQVIYDNPTLPRIVPETTSTFNNDTGAVNSTVYADIWVTLEGFKDNVVDILTSEITNDLGWFPNTNVAYLNNTQTFTEINTFDAGDGDIVQGNSQGTIVLKATGTGNPAGSISFGNTADIGISNDGVVSGYDYDGAFIFKQATTNPDALGEYIFLEENGDWRFALPSSQAGAGTYNPRSLIVAGASKNNETNFYCDGWGFDQLACATSTDGADAGIQNSLQVLDDVFVGDELNTSSIGGYKSDTVNVNSDVNVTLPNEITGGMKLVYVFGNTANIVSTTQMRMGDRTVTSSTKGFVMTCDGSVTGLGWVVDVSVFAVQGILEFNIKNSGGNTMINDEILITGTGVQSGYTTQSRSTTSTRHFDKGDIIQANINFKTVGMSLTTTDVMYNMDVICDG